MPEKRKTLVVAAEELTLIERLVGGTLNRVRKQLSDLARVQQFEKHLVALEQALSSSQGTNLSLASEEVATLRRLIDRQPLCNVEQLAWRMRDLAE